jgi:hypothetical protein
LLLFTTPRLLTAVAAAALAPHSYTRTLPVVELRGYIEARVVDPVDPMRHPGRTEYFFRTVDGRRYRLDLGGAKFYLCGHFTATWGLGSWWWLRAFYGLTSCFPTDTTATTCCSPPR